MTAPRLVVVGDALLDRDVEGRASRLCPDAPVPVLEQREVVDRPGGAALAATLAARQGAAVTLVTALGDDPAGGSLRRLLAAEDVEVVDLGLTGLTPEKVRLRADGQCLVRLDRGGPAGVEGRGTSALPGLLAGAAAVLVADYGRGVTDVEPLRAALAAAPCPLVWDPHPRGAPPVGGTTVATPNLSELQAAVGCADADAPLGRVAAAARDLVEQWAVGAVAVTLGADGALLTRAQGAPLVVPVPAVRGSDTCGAGDAFASATAVALGRGEVLPDAVAAAGAAAAAFVAGGGASGLGSPSPSPSPSAEARPAPPDGGITVATGGCFDLLHAGHVSLLRAARRLGDRLVVLLNSDASVARLKGPGRPLQPQADRRDVLRALGCVDEVVVFDEDTPVAALERIKPDVFVKGGDYAGRPLPEEEVLRRWDGQVVIVPYLSGRSTSLLVEGARRGA